VGSRGTPSFSVLLLLPPTRPGLPVGICDPVPLYYVVPEKLYPVIGVSSGHLVVGMGIWLLFSRLRSVLRYKRSNSAAARMHSHAHVTHHHERTTHDHDAADSNSHAHADAHAESSHSHGGAVHSHIPLGANGERITWRRLLALGMTGGALPCPEALVVLLATMALGRVAFGLLLIVASALASPWCLLALVY